MDLNEYAQRLKDYNAAKKVANDIYEKISNGTKYIDACRRPFDSMVSGRYRPKPQHGIARLGGWATAEEIEAAINALHSAAQAVAAAYEELDAADRSVVAKPV